MKILTMSLPTMFLMSLRIVMTEEEAEAGEKTVAAEAAKTAEAVEEAEKTAVMKLVMEKTAWMMRTASTT
jgi:hypothetical protein